MTGELKSDAIPDKQCLVPSSQMPVATEEITEPVKSLGAAGPGLSLFNVVVILLFPFKLRCSSAEKWQIGTWFVYTMELFPVIKKNKSLAEKWMQVEIITLSKLRPSKKDK